MASQTFWQPGPHTETLVAPPRPVWPASSVFGLLELLLLAQLNGDTRSISDVRKASSRRMRSRLFLAPS